MESPSGSSVLTGHGIIRLGESFEYRLPLVFRDSGAGVAHQEVQTRGIGGSRFQAHADKDFAGSVNLIALPTRLTRTWRSLPGSPIKQSGTSACTS